MLAAVRALLNGLIDYAGLFPPAKLPLEQAFGIYLDAKKTSAHRWMLGRFVCPAAQLPELLKLAKGDHAGSLLQLTVLLPQSPTADAFLPQLEAGIDAIQEFRRCWGAGAVADMLELPLPADVGVAPDLNSSVGLLHQASLRGFCEVLRTRSWESDIERTLQLLKSADKTRMGLKLRCGGVTAEAFPDDAQVASFVVQCRDAKVPWKATAGLHHPRRYWDKSLNVWHHGLLNVVVAGALAHVHPLGQADVVEILADRAGQHFRFEDDRVGWKKWSCTTEQIANARANFVTTFGSCSFEEPCADLLTMGLISAPA